MERLDVNIPGREYPVYVGRGIYGEILEGLLQGLRPRRVVVVSHPSILESHGQYLLEALAAHKGSPVEVLTFTFPEGEERKNLQTLEEGYRFLLNSEVTREDVLVAFGGGVVGDLAGFLASSYYRGIPYLQIPTTLMAMVDSSVGGKVGVDLPGAKNAVGAFYQPQAVVCDVEVLQTLPPREYGSGLAEVAKYGFLFDQDLLEELEMSQPLSPRSEIDHVAMVARCAAHKAKVVASDERDVSGERALLNYGHTFGHALESATHYRLLRHGEAVAIGMIMAAGAAVRAGMAGPELQEMHRKILKPLLGEVDLPAGLGSAALMEDMKADKKRGEEIRFVLLKGLQMPRLVDSLAEEIVEEAITEVIAEMRRAE
jgi:3-dehydroquinate synthase